MKLSEKKLLGNAGTVSASQASKKAKQEFEKYRRERSKHLVSDFDKEVKKLTKQKKNET